MRPYRGGGSTETKRTPARRGKRGLVRQAPATDSNSPVNRLLVGGQIGGRRNAMQAPLPACSLDQRRECERANDITSTTVPTATDEQLDSRKLQGFELPVCRDRA